MADRGPGSLHDTRGRVLVVEDEESVNDQLVWELVDAGFSVASARDGAAALELIDRQPFDAMVLDLIMPRIGGLAVVEELRKRELLTRVILVSEHIGALDRQRFSALGVSHVLRKPLNYQELVAVVDQSIRGEPPPRRRSPSGRLIAGEPAGTSRG